MFTGEQPALGIQGETIGPATGTAIYVSVPAVNRIGGNITEHQTFSPEPQGAFRELVIPSDFLGRTGGQRVVRTRHDTRATTDRKDHDPAHDKTLSIAAAGKRPSHGYGIISPNVAGAFPFLEG